MVQSVGWFSKGSIDAMVRRKEVLKGVEGGLFMDHGSNSHVSKRSKL